MSRIGATVTSPGLWTVVGAASGAIAVMLGAFGAHALKARLSPEMLTIFETGVRYHMYHALALIAVGLSAARWPGAGLGVSGGLMLAGIVIFSGSLYTLALTGIRWLGAITPIGGVAFIAGWAWFAFAVWRALRS